MRMALSVTNTRLSRSICAGGALLLRTSIVLMTIANLPLSKNVLNAVVWCQNTQEVYDFNFNFKHNCSMTINWTTPTYLREVSRYIVQSAEGCPAMWKSHTALDGNVYSMVIEDLSLVTACLQGTCHIRVAADLDHPNHQTERRFSHCVRISSTFYHSLETKKYDVNYAGQPVCLPIRTECPTLPTFYIGEQMIAIQIGGGMNNNYYLNRSTNQLCIRNISDTSLVVHEVCHNDTLCHLCEDTDELVLMTRAEIQTSNNGSYAMTMQPEADCVPSIVMFCSAQYTWYTDDNLVEVCLCLPLHELHFHNSDGIMIELYYNTTVPGTTMNLNPNMSRQCFDVEVPIRDIQYMHNSTSFEMCLMLLGSSDATKCVYIPDPCVEITISRSNGSITTTTTTVEVEPSISGRVIAGIVLGIAVGVVLLILVILISVLVLKKHHTTWGIKEDKKEESKVAYKRNSTM